MSTIENWINNYIIDKILEPLKYTEKLFDIGINIAKLCDKIGLGPIPTAIITGFLPIIIIAIIILLPPIIIKLIINIFRHR